MTRRLIALGPDTACETASRVMVSKRITGAPVIDPEGYPIGMISLTDLVDPDRVTREEFGFDNYYELDQGELQAHGSGSRMDGGRVKELMTEGTIRVSALAPIREAARLMTEKRVHRLLVMDGERVLGILSSLDMVRGLLDEDDET
jgi:CBS domain-containing protein